MPADCAPRIIVIRIISRSSGSTLSRNRGSRKMMPKLPHIVGQVPHRFRSISAGGRARVLSEKAFSAMAVVAELGRVG